MKATAFLGHLWRAKSVYRIHSPFVFAFYQQVLPHRRSILGRRVESFRRQLSHSQESVQFEDFGAGGGSSGPTPKTTTLGALAQKSARHAREGELLYRLCAYYQPRVCLELGTNLGISAMYQLGALPDSRFISLEGAPVLAEKAGEHCEFVLGRTPEIIVGEFMQTLPRLDWPTLALDYAFVDGNHRYQATLDYFHFLLPRMQDGGILVFDDINWSKGMQDAWREICQHPEVSVSLDLFSMGICFLRRPQQKEHFVVPFRPR